MDYKHGKFTILKSDDVFSYEDYLENCEVNGITPMGKDSNSFFNWCAEEAAVNFDDDMENIKYCKQYNVPVLVSGHLQLWHGNVEIVPKRFESVYDAIQSTIGRGDVVIEAEWNDGEIIVYVHHHDGTNVFTINALSKKGQEKVGDNFNAHDIKRLPYLYAI